MCSKLYKHLLNKKNEFLNVIACIKCEENELVHEKVFNL